MSPFDNGDDNGMDYRELSGYETDGKDDYDTIYTDYGKVEECHDEDGLEVLCDECRNDVKWKDGNWICIGCGKEFPRAEYLNYIGANIPNVECLTSCKGNYPSCRDVCPKYSR